MFKEFYENKLDIPNGIYYNPETNNLDDVMFVHLIDETTIDIKYWKDLTYHQLNTDFLTEKKPDFPQRKRDNWMLGSIYKDCYITPNNLHFIVSDNTIEVRYVDLEKLSLADYTDTVYDLFLKKVKEIYNAHEHVVILFSGGVDSLHLLSYVYKLDLMHRTTLAYSENFCVEHPSLIRNSPTMQNKLKEIKKNLHNQLYDFAEHNVYLDDLFSTNKVLNSTFTKIYTSYHLLKQFNDCAVMTGNYGNQVTFHADSWLDHLMFNSDDIDNSRNKLHALLNNNNLYMNNYLEYDLYREHFHYNHFTFNRAYFDEFNGVNNIQFYTPFAEAKGLCRKIKTNDLTFEMILDATVARELIKRNVGNLFDRYIHKRSEWDNDCCTEDMTTMLVDKKELHEKLFSIPTNITIDKTVNYNKILKLKKIPYMYIQNMIYLQHLSKIHSKYGRTE